MTTKKFSAIKLPHPKSSLEFGRFDLNKNHDLNLSIWIPRFSDLAHVIEIRKTGTTLPGQFGSYGNEELISGSYIIIDNARPELFFRRDFITKFVDTGKIHLVHNDRLTTNIDDSSLDHYQIFTKNNVLTLILLEKQYRRFGLIGKKILPFKRGNPKRYRIDVDLKDERIRKSNKYQDSLNQIFKRLGPINKLYFRYVAKKSSNCGNGGGVKPPNDDIDDCLNFFKYVINEYAIDGCQPIPLTGCSKIRPNPDKRWMNCSQLHPSLDLSSILKQPMKTASTTTMLTSTSVASRKINNKRTTNTKRMKVKAGAEENGGGGSTAAGKAQQQDGASMSIEHVQRNSDKLGKIVDIIDWLGYQLLSLDCDRKEIRSRYPADQERLDVSCAQICSVMDFELIHDNLRKIFKPVITMGNNEDSLRDCHVVLRALVLYDCEQDNHQLSQANATSCVVLLQDCAANSREQLKQVELQQQVEILGGLRPRKRLKQQQKKPREQQQIMQHCQQEELIVTVKSKQLVQM